MKTDRRWQVAKSTTNNLQPTLNEKRNTHATRHIQHTIGRIRYGTPLELDESPVEGSQAVPSRIELHIGELALHGFDLVDPTDLGASIRQELSRLLAEQGIPSSLEKSAGRTHVEGKAFKIEPGANSEIIGARIARAIYRELEQ